jgi:hypothetical protein
MHMEASSLESVPEIIECGAYGRGSAYGKGWPNIPGAKFTDSVDLPFFKRYRYTFNNLWNKKVMFGLDLIGREFLESLKIVKITTKE